ncbi:hypothetical protein D0T49_04220 [Paludibacter sp. 221]|uniref:hypothetical protein n=1 Tax=Paludibacter sp. 221 TaxID=2302939 RepID=UPI0013D161AC|nr:hypothetical protein [Paludibacter sp. 221]NDV46245.1 hypothetical protein [Paludibacter sp. 221]
MGRKKVFQSTIVDAATGVILECRNTYVNSTLEQFGMFRTTEGIEWLLNLTEIEIKILVLFHIWSDESGAVQLTPIKRDFVLRKIKISSPTLSKAISGIIRKEAVVRMGKYDFVINPTTFFKGSSKELKGKIEKFNELKKKIYGSNNSW